MDLLLDALIDSIKMLPFLGVTFLAIEIFEHKFGKTFDEKIKSAGALGPLIGSLLGILPQCGFSVIGVAFFSQGYISLGTLISIFIATSDEALPILISTPSAAGKIIPFIITKAIFAIFWGYTIDLLIKKKPFSINPIEEEPKESCCGENCIDDDFSLKSLILHTLKRSLVITGYVFAITLLINAVLSYKEVNSLLVNSYSNRILQVITASILGLIPNCAVSVGLTEVYLHNAISSAALIAGLSSNAGLALLILFKEVTDKKKLLTIVSILLACSIFTGLILTVFNLNF